MAKSTAGRKALAPAEKAGPEFIGKTPDEDAAREIALRENIDQLVDTYGDGLPWHPDHYEAAIRSELKRGCEAFLHAGGLLVVAKTCASHGEWGGMLERLGMEPRQAQRMMEAARRITSLPNASRASHLIESAGTQSKLIELLSLSEDEFTELAETGATGGLSLDDVELMTRDELRAALRDARADIAAKDEVSGKLQKRLDKAELDKSKAQRRWREGQPDENIKDLERACNDAFHAIVADLGYDDTGLRGATAALAEYAYEHNLDCTEFLGDLFGRLLDSVRTVRDDERIPVEIPIRREL